MAEHRACSICRAKGHDRRSCPVPLGERTCGKCGSRDFDEKSSGRCRPCERKRLRQRRTALRKQHRCIDCSAPLPARKHRLCERCRHEAADRSRRSYAKLKAEGVCPKCGGEREDPRFVACAGCRDDMRQRHQDRKLRGIE